MLIKDSAHGMGEDDGSVAAGDPVPRGMRPGKGSSSSSWRPARGPPHRVSRLLIPQQGPECTVLHGPPWSVPTGAKSTHLSRDVP